jgi:L-fucose mutarotase/ribose pyranase (RbsD/FucU family)
VTTSARQGEVANPPKVSWRQVLQDRIALFGHRNLVVVADSAYPAQSRDGIETIVSNADHVDVLEEVLAAVVGTKHLRPVVHTDQELELVEEEDAPGISAYRQQLSALFRQFTVNVRPHEQIISTLDQAGQTFRVLIIKTNMTIPYTSVFLELDCSYWNRDAECRLRAAMDRHLVPQA